MPFIPAGYPNMQTTGELIEALVQAGASLIEVGIPFSDPIADGPTIQRAFSETLAKKVKVVDILRAVKGVRGRVDIPLLAMVSYSIAYRHGVDRFIAECKEAGFDGLILPDLPPPEAQQVCQKINAAGLDTVLLVAPTTSRKRREEIARLSTGFIYYLSVTGITGQRERLPEDIERNLKDLRELTDRPICVGFGISKAEHVKQLAALADGAIVGSAVVKRIMDHAQQTPEEIAAETARFCRELMGGV